jgi:hypothetical protein
MGDCCYEGISCLSTFTYAVLLNMSPLWKLVSLVQDRFVPGDGEKRTGPGAGSEWQPVQIFPSKYREGEIDRH